MEKPLTVGSSLWGLEETDELNGDDILKEIHLLKKTTQLKKHDISISKENDKFMINLFGQYSFDIKTQENRILFKIVDDWRDSFNILISGNEMIRVKKPILTKLIKAIVNTSSSKIIDINNFIDKKLIELENNEFSNKKSRSIKYLDKRKKRRNSQPHML
ncbi:MAG: hypothetical protein N4A44_03850 [Alphaproteobacteria bacterium]|nr:hypothetical protein [Alphaproteobacteria bacterium]